MSQRRKLDDLSDEELVREILRGPDDEAYPCLQTLFWRYFERFERNIRAVLRSHGIAYSEQDEYYNFVFDSIYERMFGTGNFRKIASHFDFNKSTPFSAWFLGKVKRNNILDWLRTKNQDQGMTNQEFLRLRYPTSSLSRPDIRTADRTLAVESSVETDDTPDLWEEIIRTCLSRLDIRSRILIKLLYWGVIPLSNEELASIADSRGIPSEAIAVEISEYEKAFENSYQKDLESARTINKKLGAEYFFLARNEARRSNKEKEIRTLHIFDFGRIEEEARGKGLVEVDREKRRLKLSNPMGISSQDEQQKRLILLEYMECYLRVRKLRRKMDELLIDLERLFAPMNSAVRTLMGLETNMFHALKRGALAELRKCLETMSKLEDL